MVWIIGVALLVILLNQPKEYKARAVGDCTETDTGIDYTTSGRVTVDGVNYVDTCALDVLVEYYCDGEGNQQYISHDCTNDGQVCSLGKCTSEASNGGIDVDFVIGDKVINDTNEIGGGTKSDSGGMVWLLILGVVGLLLFGTL